MRKIYLSLISLTAILILTAAPFSQLRAQASVTAKATAEVITALAATERASLNFGRFSPEAEGGEIRLTPDGSRAATGSVVLSGGSYNPAVFYITGQNEATVTISLPTAPAILINTETGKTMEVDNWTSNPGAGLGTGVLTDGWLNLNVGATLKVGPRSSNPVGIYSGTYTVTFSYN